MKQRINISLTPDTVERLKTCAWENHKTVSQAITDWIWSAKVKNAQVRGQDISSGRTEETVMKNRRFEVKSGAGGASEPFVTQR